jgi:hypothetical protein
MFDQLLMVPHFFMVARTSSLNKLVLASIKKVMAPLEVGQTFALNLGVVN